MIDVILRDPVADVSLRLLAPTDIAAWRDRRLNWTRFAMNTCA